MGLVIIYRGAKIGFSGYFKSFGERGSAWGRSMSLIQGSVSAMDGKYVIEFESKRYFMIRIVIENLSSRFLKCLDSSIVGTR